MLENVLVPIVIMTSMFAMIFGIVYLGSRERMAMIERGLNPRVREPRQRRYVNLRRGLLLIGAGSGLLIAHLLNAFVLHPVVMAQMGNTTISSIPSTSLSLVAIGAGLGLFIAYLIEKKETAGKGSDGQPGGRSNDSANMV
jgi:uncharacterized membrane protein YdbT with pleckstrin-like domain